MFRNASLELLPQPAYFWLDNAAPACSRTTCQAHHRAADRAQPLQPSAAAEQCVQRPATLSSRKPHLEWAGIDHLGAVPQRHCKCILRHHRLAGCGRRMFQQTDLVGTIQQRSSKCILCHHYCILCHQCLAGCMIDTRKLKLSAFSSACRSKHACQMLVAAERCSRHKGVPGASGALHGVLVGAGGSRSAVVPMCRRQFRPQAAAIKAPSRHPPEVCAATSTECPASNALTAVCVRAKAEQRRLRKEANGSGGRRLAACRTAAAACCR